MSRLQDIVADLLAGKVVLSEKELSDERMKVCHECPAYRKLTVQCSLCNCFLELKTKILRASCPIEKW